MNKSILSYTLSSIPMNRNTDGNRLQMAANHHSQAMSIEKSEVPYLLTTMNTFANSGLFVLNAPVNMKIIDIFNNIIIYTTEQDKNTLRSLIVPYYHNIYVNPGDIISIGDIISKYRNVDDNNYIMIGKNSNVIFNYWDGFVFEDAIVCNESVKDDFRSYYPAYIDISFSYKKLNFIQHIRPGKILNNGAVLSYLSNKFYPDEVERLEISSPYKIRYILVYIPDTKEAKETYKMQMSSVKNFLDTYNIENFEKSTEIEPEERKIILNILSNSFNKSLKDIQIILYGEYIYDVNIGDKFTNRHGNKGIISLIEKIPSVNIGNSIFYQPEFCLNPEGIRRMNLSQLGEMSFSFILKYVIPVIIEKLETSQSSEKIFNFIFDKFVKPLGQKEYSINYQLYKSIGTYNEIISSIKKTGMRIFLTNSDGYLYQIHDMMKLISNMNIPNYIVIHNKLCSYGTMYMMRLYHTSNSKITFKNQRLGEQEIWSLAQTAPTFLQEMFLRSNDKIGLEKLIKTIALSKIDEVNTEVSPYDIKSNSHSIDELKALLFALNISDDLSLTSFFNKECESPITDQSSISNRTDNV